MTKKPTSQFSKNSSNLKLIDSSSDSYKLKQCVHDIRSPLALIDIIIKDNFNKIATHEQAMLRNALKRIAYITNSALEA